MLVHVPPTPWPLCSQGLRATGKLGQYVAPQCVFRGPMTSLTPPCFCRNYTCVPENRDSTVCVCNMQMENIVFGDTYLLDLWAGTQWLWSGTFSPGEYGERGLGGGTQVFPQPAAPAGEAGSFSEGFQTASSLFPNLMGFLPLSGPQFSHL